MFRIFEAITKNIPCSAVTLVTKDYLLFSFEDIVQISVKKKNVSKLFNTLSSKIFIKISEIKIPPHYSVL